MNSNVVSIRTTSVRILVLCPDESIGKPVADRLRRAGAQVRYADDAEIAMAEIDEYGPDALWVVAAGDQSYGIGNLCRVLEVEHVTSPLTMRVFWVGDDQPTGLSILAGCFPDLPQIDQMINLSRGTAFPL